MRHAVHTYIYMLLMMALLEARTSQHIHAASGFTDKKMREKKYILRLDSVDRKKSALLIFYMPSKSTIVNLINILTGVYSIQHDTYRAWLLTFTDNGTSSAKIRICHDFISFRFTPFFCTLRRNGPLLLWFQTKFPDDYDDDDE